MSESNPDTEQSGRRRRYPSISLPEAVAALEAIHRNVGPHGATRLTLAEALGYSSLSGAARAKIASIAYYGFLERAGDRSRISLLGRKVLIPKSEEERKQALREAAVRPELFRELMERHAGSPIPTMLRNLLVREHQLLPSVSESVEQAFRETVECAGLLVDGVLCSLSEESPASVGAGQSDESERHVGSSLFSGSDLFTMMGGTAGNRGVAEGIPAKHDYTIPLNNQGRTALIRMPLPLGRADLEKVQAWVQYMTFVVDEKEG